MDLVGSIINSKEYSVPVIKKELFSDDRKEQRDSSMCNICGEFFSRANMLLHKLTHTSENEREKVSGSVSNDVLNADEKPSYTCKICGKIYTVRKTFVTHKNNHRRNKKLKELGVHPFDKKACLNLKAMNNTAISESKPVNDNFKLKTKSELSAKSMMNPDVTEKPMCVNEDFKLKSELPVKLMMNLDPTANPINVNGGSSKMKSEMPMTYMVYPGVTEKPICVNYSTADLILKPKSIINFDPTVNPMSCAADWAPPKPVESHNDVPPIVSPIQLVSEDSSLTKKSPAKKTLYRCNMCDKTYTEKKALVNHRVNHTQNHKKHKFLYYDRPNEKTKKSLKKIMEKAKKKN